MRGLIFRDGAEEGFYDYADELTIAPSFDIDGRAPLTKLLRRSRLFLPQLIAQPRASHSDNHLRQRSESD
jgi:hypothetical protein